MKPATSFSFHAPNIVLNAFIKKSKLATILGYLKVEAPFDIHIKILKQLKSYAEPIVNHANRFSRLRDLTYPIISEKLCMKFIASRKAHRSIVV